MALKIAFHINQLCERGTGVALYDYAKYNEELLSNQSIVFYNNSSPHNVQSVVEKFASRFEMRPYEDFSEVDDFIVDSSIDAFYALKSGLIDHVYSKQVPNMVHAVFGNSLLHRHGNSCAYVSEWLSSKYSFGLVPCVPHIVSCPILIEDLVPFRRKFGIPNSATVFGGYGGRDSFNIQFVKENVIPFVLDSRSDIYFFFMNFEPFIDHPRAIFLPGTTDLHLKRSFIASCDAMLHARSIGETFGLACAEFTMQRKMIFTYGRSIDMHHASMSSCIIYNDCHELISQLLSFDPLQVFSIDFNHSYFKYTPEYVMDRFDRYLIHPAISSLKKTSTIALATLPIRGRFAAFCDKPFHFIKKLIKIFLMYPFRKQTNSC